MKERPSLFHGVGWPVIKVRAKHVCEYVILRLFTGVMRVLPYKISLSIGWVIAWLSFFVFSFRRKAAESRIHSVFSHRFSQRETRRIAWLSWRNFVFAAVDMMRIPTITLDWAKAHVSGYEEPRQVLLDQCRTGKGAVIVCPHMGSWELAGVIGQLIDIPIFFITGRQKNPLVDRYLNRLRGSTGLTTVQRGSSLLKNVLKKLRNSDVLAIMPDVRAPAKEITVRFLGSEANVPAGIGLFSRQAGVPIVPLIMLRSGWSHHVFRACKLIYPDDQVDKHEDWRRMTQEIFGVIEKAIMETPEQWFWFNKRWILDPIE